MTPWAFSGLSQKLGWPIWALSCSRWDCLVGTSKGVPQVRQAADHLVRPAAQVGVHRFPRESGGQGEAPAACRSVLQTSIPGTGFAAQFGLAAGAAGVS